MESVRYPTLTCFIFAGGMATRLHPHTMSVHNQKPLLIIGSSKQRLIDYALDLSQCASRTVIVANHMPERAKPIEDYVLQRPGIQVLRDKTRATALIDQYEYLAREMPDGDVAILAADHIHEKWRLSALYERHLERGAAVTLLAVPPKNYGEYVIAQDGAAKSVLAQFAPGAFSTAGTYIVKTRYLLAWMRQELSGDLSQKGRSFYRHLVCPAVEGGEAAIFELPPGGYWDDAGTLARYHFNNMRLSGGENVVSADAWISEDISLARCVVVGNPVLEGEQSLSGAIVSVNGDQTQITQAG